MTHDSKKITNILLVLSVVVLLFGSGYKAGEYKSTLNKSSKSSLTIFNPSSSSSIRKTAAKEMDFSLFWDTWNQIETKYVDQKKVDPQKMYYGAIKGMVAAVGDQYTFFLTPEENKQTKDDLGGKFEGIGAQLGMESGSITVVAPLKNSPSERAGLKPGDIITKVNGESVIGWVLPQAVAKIRGEKGTKVKLKISRGVREFEVEIMRDTIKVESVEITLNEQKKDCGTICGDVAYLKLNQFGENTVDEWEQKVEEIKSKWDTRAISGVVLDLRDNPGGYLESSVYLAGEFLPKGALVVRQESPALGNKDYTVMRTGSLLNIPLVVMINKGSASAAEILAGALRDHKRAKLIGEKSFGKGSVQEAMDLQDGAGLHVTVAKWILPKGDWINHKGIEPEVKVENKIAEGNTLTRESDTQLDLAIEELLH